MIRFIDFKPTEFEAGTMLKEPKYEETSETLLRINYWLETNHIVVLNIETLFIPNLGFRGKTATSDGSYFHGQNVRWYQVFRVWYEEQEAPSPPA